MVGRMYVVVLWVAVLVSACSGASEQVVPPQTGGGGDDVRGDRVGPSAGLEDGQCWTHADCEGQANGPMCSLQHSGTAPPQMPDTCAGDQDCTEPGHRCVQRGGHRACGPPGVCEACCRP